MSEGTGNKCQVWGDNGQYRLEPGIRARPFAGLGGDLEGGVGVRERSAWRQEGENNCTQLAKLFGRVQFPSTHSRGGLGGVRHLRPTIMLPCH